MSIKRNNFLTDIFYMQLALKQARKALGNTGQNPSVGCIIVKNHCVISSGHTGLNGRPHAEINAINAGQNKIKNSHMYVTLEPCSHYGNTAPCVKSIIKKKISKVFFSMKDPDKRSFDKSIKQFGEKGIKSKTGICFDEIASFYRSYIKFKEDLLPFVTCKLAMSKDFFINDKKNKWITNKYSRGRVHLMRSNHDCLITSAKTVILDNPRLTCRIKGLENKSPARVILDKELKVPMSSQIVKDAKFYNTIIFFNKKNARKLKILNNLKIKLIKMPLQKDGNFNLLDVLLKIKQLGFSRIFLESGLKLTVNFLKEDLVDDLILFISDKKLKHNGSHNFRKQMKLFLKNKKFVNEKVNLLGDKLLTCRM